jgi:hypothetical protein
MSDGAVGGAGPVGPGEFPGPAQRHAWGQDAAVVIRAVWLRPRLWWSALGALRRMARRGWWRRAPFLPVPDEQYWRFRLETAYGGDGDAAAATPKDVVAYLRWCQRSRPRRG